jgi:hypothetical protein
MLNDNNRDDQKPQEGGSLRMQDFFQRIHLINKDKKL